VAILDNENPIVVRNIAIENRLGSEVIATLRFRTEDGTLTVALTKRGTNEDFAHFGLTVPIIGQ
jgi:hypothetical protein